MSLLSSGLLLGLIMNMWTANPCPAQFVFLVKIFQDSPNYNFRVISMRNDLETVMSGS